MTPQAAFTDQFSNQTAYESILATRAEQRELPEDMRSDRYGYNPGWDQMIMDSRHCGLQSGRVEPGKLTYFRTFSMAGQNFKAVDAASPEPRVIPVELLAGQQIANLMEHYTQHGFRELVPLRAVLPEEAKPLFIAAHPPLALGVEEGIIPPCPYTTENNGVCISCRQLFLKALVHPVNGEGAVAQALKDSVAAGKFHMTNMWNSWVVELSARMNNAAGDKGAIGVLSPGHEYVMRQLHKQTPSDAELAKVNAANNALGAAMIDLKETFAGAIQSKASDDRIAELEAKIEAQSRQFQETIDKLTSSQESKEPAKAKKSQ